VPIREGDRRPGRHASDARAQPTKTAR